MVQKSYEEMKLENRIVKLKNNPVVNANLIRKAERNLRNYQKKNAAK